MSENDDLILKLREYDSFLTSKITEETSRREGETMIASISCDNIIDTYRSAQQELYKLFPEVAPTTKES